MLTAKQCDQVAELVISTYGQTCECHTPDDVRKAGEMLISKTARAIEKHCGNDTAIEVLNRTVLHVAKKGGAA